MKRGNIGMALFTGLFVSIVMLFIEFSALDIDKIMRIIIAGLSALVGGLIGSKLYPNKE